MSEALEYLEIRLSEPAGDPRLMGVVVRALHDAIAGLAVAERPGICFPDYAPHSLGARVRVIGPMPALLAVEHDGVLDTLVMEGFVEITPRAAVPESTERVRVRRDRRFEHARRAERRHQSQGLAERFAASPCLMLPSTSTGRHFPLAITQALEPEAAEPEAGFGSYGLSREGSTLPWFESPDT